MQSLRDALSALGEAPLSLRQLATTYTWPPLTGDGHITASQMTARFSEAGAELRVLCNAGGDLWTHMDRDGMTDEIRRRLRDPAIMEQKTTALCGPMAILVELARRNPSLYVRMANDLLSSGKFVAPGGLTVEAEEELRHEPVGADYMASVDWMLSASMRDSENLWEDVEGDNISLEGLTMPGAMLKWTARLLSLHAESKWCWDILPLAPWSSDELDLIKWAQNAVTAGGVAFLLVDQNVIKPGDGDRAIWHRYEQHAVTAQHPENAPPLAYPENGGWLRSRDDVYPDHWVVFLGDLRFWENRISLRVWSWGREYVIEGNKDSFREYLFAVVTGWPV